MTLATEPESVIQGQNRAYAWGFVIVKESKTRLSRHWGLRGGRGALQWKSWCPRVWLEVRDVRSAEDLGPCPEGVQ